MKIKILQSFSGVVPPELTATGFHKNQVVEVPSIVAEEWIRIGYAVAEEEAPKSKPVEVKEAPPVEETPVIETKKKSTRKKKETE